MERDDLNGHSFALQPSHKAEEQSPFRRHPVRWTVAAGGLAAMLAFGGYGVTQAAATTDAGSGASAIAGGNGGPPGVGGAPISGGSVQGGPSGQTPTASPGESTGNGTAGTVTAFSGDSITVRTRGQSALKVVVNSATTFKDGSRTTTGAALKKGDFVMVVGSTSSDGTVTAKTVTFGSTPNGAPGAGTTSPAD
jgi:hypothetical protein